LNTTADALTQNVDPQNLSIGELVSSAMVTRLLGNLLHVQLGYMRMLYRAMW